MKSFMNKIFLTLSIKEKQANLRVQKNLEKFLLCDI